MPLNTLVDLIELSKKRCPRPIKGIMAYATKDNFVGRVVDGYSEEAAGICLLNRVASEQLCKAQTKLNAQGFSFFVYDGFRPLRAVRDFAKWYHEPPLNAHESKRKQLHFPHLEKTDLVRLGYAPETISRHCFGRSIDLTIFSLSTGNFLNMGTIFDFFDATSHHPETPKEKIGKEAFDNRELLKNIMQEFGFLPYDVEWWHFDYHKEEMDEPGDLVITSELAGLNVE